MNTTEKIQTYLNDPKIVSVNTVDAHSDHKYFESLAEFSEGEMKLRQSLNGKWKIHYAQNTNQVLKDFYKTEFDETDLNFINVPGHLELQGFGSPQYVNTQYPWDGKEFLRPPQVPQESNAVASYVKHFTLNDALKDKKVFISFQGVATSIFVWVNGNFVGYSEDSFTPSEFEISDYLVEGDNKLAVAVYRYSTASWLEDQDFWRLYGIFRDVYLYAIPKVHVQDLFVKGDYDYQTKAGQLDIDLKTVGDYEDKKIKYVLSDHEGIVKEGDASVNADGELSVSLENLKIKPWSAESPKLYNLTLHVLEDDQQWSGSATVNSDGSIQLYYTKNDTSGGKLNWQQLASATLNLAVENDEVVIKSVENDHILFGGDNYHYQSYPKFMSTFNDDHNHDGNPDRTDNYCLRDPHIIEDNGSRYLIFESNTGDENYQGEKQIYKWSNYGGDDAFNLKSFLNIVNNKHLYNLASWANGSIGILKLDDNEKNPSVAELYTPLVTSHMVTDEVERPSVVKMGGKYYLFTASRINKSTDAEGTVAAREAVGDDVVMLGFVSDSLRGKYRPLNGSGVVLTASVPADWRTSTYSYYAVPVEGSSDTLLVTSYMTNRGGIAGAENKSTWAPSFLIKMNADDTTEVLPKMTNQGDWIWDKSSESLVHVGDQNSAKLPNEDFNVDYYAVSGYGLKPHTYPTVDGSTGVSEAHGVLTVTVKDGKDKKADKPETPVSPTEGNHSVDDKTNKPGTSKPADNNQPSADKEDKPTNPTNPDSPARTPFPNYGDHSNDNNSSNDHHVAVPVKPSTGDSVGDRRPVAQAAEIATPVPKTIVATGPTVPTNTVKEESVTETEAPKPVKSEEKVQSHGVDKANEVTKSDESSKGNNTKVAAKLATTPKTPSDSEGSNSNILSILATIFAAIASLALLGYGLVTGKIHLPKK